MRNLFAFLFALGAAAAAPAAEITVRERAFPAGETALAPNLALAPDGTVWASWIEHASAADEAAPVTTRLGLARLTAGGEARSIASPALATDHSPSPAEVPQLAVAGDGRVHLVWLDPAMRAQRAAYDPAGDTWSEPEPFTRAPGDRERFSLTRLQDGRVLAAWLDSRDYARTREQKLIARIIDAADDTEQLVAGRVCECCETALTPLLDGGALLAFRGRDADEIRDIQVARWRRGTWSEPRVVNADGWKIKACPVNGPRVHGDGSRAALAWFTAAGGRPQVLVSATPDAAGRWLSPQRVDRGQPAGHVDTVWLRDGAVLVSWLEADGSWWLRRLTPEFTAGAPVQLAPPGGVALRTVPRLALRQDYAGGDAIALLVAVHQQPRGGLRLVEVRVPEGALLKQERACDCAPAAGDLRGFFVRGRVLERDPAAGRIRIAHTEVPGVLEAGRREVELGPEELLMLSARTEFLARIEPAGDGWRLFAVRALAAPAE